MADEKTNEKTTSAYKPSGKWASEAFDFFRLFNRVGNQITGLIILQLCWIALLLLLVQLTRGDSQQPYIGVPQLSQGWELKIENIYVTSIYWFGVTVIFGIWLFSSGLYLYIFQPLWRLLSNAIGFLLLIIAIILTILLLPVSLVIWLVKKVIVTSRYRKLKQSKEYESFAYQAFKSEDEQFTQDQLQAMLSQTPVEVQRKVRKKIDQDSKIMPDWPQKEVVGIISSIIRQLLNIGTIGLAPLYSYSYDEDQKAAKAPMQIFAAAIVQLRLSLKEIDAVHLIRYRDLPSLIRIATERRAQTVRRLLGWDVMLWGSYVSVDPPRIWLNIEQSLQYELQNRRTSINGEQWDIAFEEDPFNSNLEIHDSMVVMAQDDPFDAYIIVAISFILSLQSRRTRIKRTWFNDMFRPAWYGQDRVITHLIREILFRLNKRLIYEEPYPTPTRIIVDLAGRWIAKQLRPDIINVLDRPYAIGALEQVAQKCTFLDPNSPSHYYRLAAIKCIQNDKDGALKALERANANDKRINWLDPIFLETMASIRLEQATDSKSSEDEKNKAIALSIAYCSRLIQLAPDRKRKLKEELCDTFYFKILCLRQAEEAESILSVSETILLDMLEINLNEYLKHEQ